MDNQTILSIYEEVSVITEQMLLAAQNNDWDSLIALEMRCASHINVLERDDQRIPPSDAIREKKISLIKKILADDHEIRALTEPRLAQLSALISNAHTARTLQDTYRPNSTS